MNNYIKDLEWRYATKKFDAEKKVSATNLEKLKRAIQLAASSYGLQPYEIFIISSTEIKEKLQPAAWGQSQVLDASHVFVFCNKTQVEDAFVDNFIKRTSEERNLPLEGLKDYAGFMKSKINELSKDQQQIWTAKQTYIAFGNLLSAAAHLKIDACPMEGFEPAKFNEILGLNEKGLSAAVIAAVGYRSKDDVTQNFKKVRRPENELFTQL
jgi:nitroreductase